ncbi:MAG: TIGR03862 family flavoprotein [Pseudomonadota bacterium]
MPERVAIIGAGPAGLMAAERITACRDSAQVTVYERMPRPARKFLLAGRGGLNLTNTAEPVAFRSAFATGVGGDDAALAAAIAPLDDFDAEALREWCEGLGVATFVGSSGRVFPVHMKASPLLRAWLQRLDERGVTFKFRNHWRGFTGTDGLSFDTDAGPNIETADVTILALGGASWPRLGADGQWRAALTSADVETTAFMPSNVGVTVDWSPHFAAEAAGLPLKRVTATLGGRTVSGELIVSRAGLEGGPIYALSPELRTALLAVPPDDLTTAPVLLLDLRPDLTIEHLADKLARAKKGRSLATRLKSQAGLDRAAALLVREPFGDGLPIDTKGLAARIKAMPIPILGLQSLERAISSVGGIATTALTADLMLKPRAGVFVAGEMIDWDAPTGGYLLHACFAQGRRAAEGAAAWLSRR